MSKKLAACLPCELASKRHVAGIGKLRAGSSGRRMGERGARTGGRAHEGGSWAPATVLVSQQGCAVMLRYLHTSHHSFVITSYLRFTLLIVTYAKFIARGTAACSQAAASEAARQPQ